MKAIRSIITPVLFALLSLLFALTIVSKWYPFFGKVGVVTWYISFGLFFILAFKNLGFILKSLTKKKYVLTFTMILFLTGLVILHFNDSKSISFETANQTNCILTHLENADDWGFNKTCMNGYPARQYLLSALPTLFLGRSPLALHLGGSLYLFLGLFIFSGSALRLFNDEKIGDIAVASILAAFLHLTYFNHFMFIYEQSIFPFSMSLIAVGLLLDFERKAAFQTIFFIGIICMYLVFSYTPGLASYFLIVALLATFLFKKGQERFTKPAIAIVMIFSLISFWLSLGVRSDINIRGGATTIQLKDDLTAGLKHLVWQDQGSPLVSPLFNFIFLGALFLGLFFIFGFQGFVIAVWSIGVLILSVVSKGYWYYPIDFRLHRALIIFPFIFFLIVEKLKALDLTSKKIRYASCILFLFLFITGAAYHLRYMSMRKDSRNIRVMLWLRPHFATFMKLNVASGDKKNIIYFDTPLGGPIDDSYSSQKDFIAYFLPGSTSEILDSYCSGLLHNNGENIFLFADDSELQKDCYKNHSLTLKYMDSFYYKTDDELKFYRVSVR